jgi:hypothetical protein
MYKIRHPKADTDRLYVKRKGGGRGLSQIEAACKTEIINLLKPSGNFTYHQVKH